MDAFWQYMNIMGGAVVRDAPAGVVADKGERARFRSDALCLVTEPG
jgi:hypothetical protein